MLHLLREKARGMTLIEILLGLEGGGGGYDIDPRII